MRRQRRISKNKNAPLGKTMTGVSVRHQCDAHRRIPSAFNFFPAIPRGSLLAW
jgi:hypothetical protein